MASMTTPTSPASSFQLGSLSPGYASSFSNFLDIDGLLGQQQQQQQSQQSDSTPTLIRRESSPPPRHPRPAVAVACVQCRTRHLRCGGGKTCPRCQNDGLKCTYVKSRRGCKTSKKPEPEWSQVETLAHDDSPALHTLLADRPGLFAPVTPAQSPEGSSQSTSDAFSAFFDNFYPAHPFLLPRDRLLDFLSTDDGTHLEFAIHFIGSIYVQNGQANIFEASLSTALFDEDTPRNAYLVQALMLLAMGIQINGDPERASDTLNSAIDLALDLGMNYDNFAVTSGAGDPMKEEMWRRTWWQLYVIDAMISSSNKRSAFRLCQVTSSVGLPCEEADFISGNIPTPRRLEEYDDSVFMEENTVFSSFTYLIDAIRLLGRVMSVNPTDPLQSQEVEYLETCITNFHLHLPDSKKGLISSNGQLDEVLFHAHLVAAASSILLHQPRSNLIVECTKNVKTCIRNQLVNAPTRARVLHSSETIRAAKAVSRLSNLSTPLTKHTPFFTCITTQAAVVHLSHWSFLLPDIEDSMVKQQVRQDIGVLRTLAQTWPIGKRVLDQVKGVAQNMFAVRKALNVGLTSRAEEAEILQCFVNGGQTLGQTTSISGFNY